jgi:hypothetical protein
MVTVMPLLTPALVASMVPSLAATKALAIQNPRPSPDVTWACRLPRKNFWPSRRRQQGHDRHHRSPLPMKENHKD